MRRSLRGAEGIGPVRNQDRDQTLAMIDNIIPGQRAAALSGARLAQGQETAETAIGGAVGGIDKQRGAVGQVEPAADNGAHAGDLGRFVRPHDAGQRMTIGDAERSDPEQGGLSEQFLDARRAAQEREVRRDLQLGIGGHANTPWMYQRRSPEAGSSPLPLRNSQKRSPQQSSTMK
jgi:hypothetical protein